MSAPYTGPNKHWSPLERAGVNSSFPSWTDALFPMPGGPGSRDRVLVHDEFDQDNARLLSEDKFRENLAFYNHQSRNPADQQWKRVKSKHKNKKRR